MNVMKRNLLLLIVTLLTAVCPVIAQTDAEDKVLVASLVQNSDGSTYTLTFEAFEKSSPDIQEKWNMMNWDNTNTPYISSAENITKVVFKESVKGAKPKTTFAWFNGLSNLTSIENLGYLDTSEVTTMYSMFWGCKSLTSIDLSGFDTSKVTDMRKMFYGCSGLTNLDLSSFNTSNVTTMEEMFYKCTSLANIVFGSNFKTEKVTDMGEMFGYTSLSTIDLSGFRTPSLENMSSMFGGCTKLKEIDFSSFDTPNLKYMAWMFSGCSSLSKIEFGDKFNTSKVTNMQMMFMGCESLTTLNLKTFDFSKAQTNKLIEDCGSLKVLILGDKPFKSYKYDDTFTRTKHLYDDPIYLIFGFDRKNLGDADHHMYSSNNIIPPYYNLKNGRFTIADTLDCNSDYTPKVKAKTDLWLKGRSIKGSTWSTFVIPASVTYDQIVDAVGSCEVCVLDSYDGNTVKFKTTTETIPANTPMLVRPKVGQYTTIYNISFVNVDVVSSDGSDLTSTTTPDSEGRYASFIGTYKKEITIGKDCFYYQNNEFRRSNGNSKVNCTRAYFKFSDITADSYGSPAKKFVVDDGTTVTAIDAIDGEPVNADLPAYNLAGQRVGKDYKGIVIVGGKKILRK